jgi:hypothetical protein
MLGANDGRIGDVDEIERSADGDGRDDVAFHLHAGSVVGRIHDGIPPTVDGDAVVAAAPDGVARNHVVRAGLREVDSIGVGGD